MSNVITMIPVRMASVRFPNKPLCDINGKTLIRRVYEHVMATNAGDVAIAAGDEAIVEHCKTFGARAILTDPKLPSGTDRIAAALKEIDPSGSKYEFVVNFQGDNINVDPKINLKLIDLMKRTGSDLTTAARIITDEEEKVNPNIVKIAMGIKEGENEGRCLYFSRATIPYTREPLTHKNQDIYHHIGVYCFNAESLQKMVKAPEGILEAREKLEQLRLLELGMSCYATIIDKIKLIEEAPADINTKEEYEESLKWIK
ncbi:MAG: 3-deoxy-manno-octulosonate cytidylyltransferase [Alphaproteobacteria bacterium ADurb.Bin438]|nr:MAG: 3-deoxy-manno-octulosonate cytidylyltransferase [Alphaproteobacteria bacterium ADurb.Bin438]